MQQLANTAKKVIQSRTLGSLESQIAMSAITKVKNLKKIKNALNLYQYSVDTFSTKPKLENQIVSMCPTIDVMAIARQTETLREDIFSIKSRNHIYTYSVNPAYPQSRHHVGWRLQPCHLAPRLAGSCLLHLSLYNAHSHPRQIRL